MNRETSRHQQNYEARSNSRPLIVPVPPVISDDPKAPPPNLNRLNPFHSVSSASRHRSVNETHHSRSSTTTAQDDRHPHATGPAYVLDTHSILDAERRSTSNPSTMESEASRDLHSKPPSLIRYHSTRQSVLMNEENGINSILDHAIWSPGMNDTSLPSSQYFSHPTIALDAQALSILFMVYPVMMTGDVLLDALVFRFQHPERLKVGASSSKVRSR